QPWIVASRSAGGASGCSRSIGSRGPVCEPGATEASEAASINSIPPPLARAGTVPTHTSTGTGRSTSCWPSATASRPIVPALSSCNTTTARSATAWSRWSCRYPRRGLSIAPSTLITSTRSPDGAWAMATRGYTATTRNNENNTREHKERRIGRTIVPRRGVSSEGSPGKESHEDGHPTRGHGSGACGSRPPTQRPLGVQAGRPPLAVGRPHRILGAARCLDLTAVPGRRHGGQGDPVEARRGGRRLHEDPAPAAALDHLRLRRQDRARAHLSRQPRGRASAQDQPLGDQSGAGGG